MCVRACPFPHASTGTYTVETNGTGIRVGRRLRGHMLLRVVNYLTVHSKQYLPVYLYIYAGICPYTHPPAFPRTLMTVHAAHVGCTLC